LESAPTTDLKVDSFTVGLPNLGPPPFVLLFLLLFNKASELTFQNKNNYPTTGRRRKI